MFFKSNKFMKEIIFYSIICIIGFFWLADTTIQFNPFKISFNHLWFATGMYLILFGIAFIRYDERKSTMKDIDKLFTIENKIEND